LYAALAAAIISGLLAWRWEGPQRKAVLLPHKGTNAAIETAHNRHSPRGEPTKTVGTPEFRNFTNEERAASTEILSALRQAFNAIELANAEVIYQMDNEYVQHTFIQISPPAPEQVAAVWDNLMKQLTAKNLRTAVAEDIWSKAQYMENRYVGRRDLPFRVLHSWRTKGATNATGNLAIHNFSEKPDIRFNEHGSPFLSSNGEEAELSGPDLRKKQNWERYEHLLPLMPELLLSDQDAERAAH
jgi:hypothetical protein